MRIYKNVIELECKHKEQSCGGLDSLFACGGVPLALLIARVREDQRLVNALARFVLQVREHREKWFWQLSSEALKQSLARMLEMYFCICI